MATKKQKVEEYFGLRPTKYSFVEEFKVDQSIAGETTLSMTLRSLDEADKNRLSLDFKKVRNIKLDATNTILQFALLNIVPVDDQWEDVNFRVFEDDQAMDCSFLCADFTASIIEAN